MSICTSPLPARRADLVLRPLGDEGQHVVKDPRSGEFFHLGEQEHFLIAQLDGEKDAAAICGAFEERFGERLAEEELDGFVETAREKGLLEIAGGALRIADAGTRDGTSPNSQSATRNAKSKQSILYWRKKLFDPDRLFDALEPKIGFFWTRGFFVFSAACILSATWVLSMDRQHLAGSVQHALRRETVFYAWLVLFAVTTLHEFAHGLTCKHYCGEVREIGFLLMFFMPCFYCNVSDAWLFRERSKRLWVTFAGGYFELFLWALAVFVWRLTMPDSIVNYLAFVIVVSSGLRTLFNFNPLIKLDGYYLLSDWLEVPNLQQRGADRFKAQLRRFLWGAQRPEAEPRGRTLFAYGLSSWLYSLVFLLLILWGMFWFLSDKWGVFGMSAVTLLGLVSSRGMLKDTSKGEARRMLTARQKRLAAWLCVLATVATVLTFVRIEDRAGGGFVVRPAVRSELRASSAGFLKELPFDEGDHVTQGTVVAQLEIPDLDSRFAQKQAEIRETTAKLRLLQAGARPEEIDRERRRVERAKRWRDLARQDLAKMRQALLEELARVDTQIAACQAELAVARDSYERARSAAAQKAVSIEELHGAAGKYRVCQARLEQFQAEKRARQATGVLEAESELARRQKELAEAEASLRLLEAGTRPEEIEAERARLARLDEELRCLTQTQQRLTVVTSTSGTITTARLKEKVGQYVREGELICVVEEPSDMEVEISLSEQEVARIQSDQFTRLKARALPFETFRTHVDRVAPAAGKGDVQSTVVVYCQLDNCSNKLRPGMTGYARIDTGPRSIGSILLDRILRFVRTEFWW